ncbi:MAG: substrate-binding domain-containing protein [Halobacteriaceae archaeon]
MVENTTTDDVSRRKILAVGGAVGAAGLAGCSSVLGSSGPANLHDGGSSTVYPIAKDASAYWGANRPAGDSDYWQPSSWGIQTDKNLADYWGGLYGFSGSGESGSPPFEVTVKLSHSGTGCTKVMNGQYDIGNSSAPVQAELDLDDYSKFKDHVVGVDGQPLVVSSAVKQAGVEQITLEELKGIYTGEITNWSALGGPDKDILVLGRVKNSGTSSSFRANVFGDSGFDTSVDQRYGQNQQLATAISNSDNAISYLALAFVDTAGVAPIGLNVDGTLYEYGKNLGASEYPLSRDLHMYTYGGTSKKEAAFLRMILSDFGQETFVKPANYFTLPADRQQTQLSKLPEPTN